MSAIEEIKDKLSIEDLVGQYVQLKKTGRSLKGLCPFHSEKTPSFVVSPERGIAYCFGCNRGGDVFKFIQEIEGVDFGDALKILAEKTGVKLDDYRKEKPVPKDQKELLMDVHEKAAVFYERNLWQGEEGAKVLEYLQRRGLTRESIKLFRVGFSPDSYDATHSHLLKEGFTKKMLVLAGLALSKETTMDRIYDRFRGRLMFPVFDSLGRVVAFGGRALKKEQEPKYVNSPETVIYRKSNILYGFFHAKQAIKKSGEAVMVEGYMDLIATFQAGVQNVVATSGTALTSRHLHILKPFARTLMLAFDMDLAGQEAARRAYDLSRDFEYEIKVVSLPEGKDPADFARMHGEKLAEVVKNAFGYGEYFYRKLIATYGTDGVAAKRKIMQEFMPLFHQLKSNIEKDEYVRRLADDLGLKETQVYDEIKNVRLPDYHPARAHGSLEERPEEAKKYGVEELLIGLMINFPRMAAFLNGKIGEDLFSEQLKPIYKAYCDKYNDVRVEAGFDVMSRLPQDIQGIAQVLSLYVSEKYGEIGEEAVEREMGNLLAGMKRNYIGDRTRELEKKIKESELSGNRQLCRDLLLELSNLRSHGSN
jgi:DNA primase